MTVKEWYDKVRHAINCGNCKQHPMAFTYEDVARVIHFFGRCSCSLPDWNPYYNTCGSYCEKRSFSVLYLHSGNIATFMESSDTSGHG